MNGFKHTTVPCHLVFPHVWTDVTLGRIVVKISGEAQLEDTKTLQKVSYAETLKF
jgi:hypothetical protein